MTQLLPLPRPRTLGDVAARLARVGRLTVLPIQRRWLPLAAPRHSEIDRDAMAARVLRATVVS